MVGIFYTITPADIEAWPAPNYSDPVSRQWLPGYVIAFEIVATVLVMVRLCLRGRQGSSMVRSYGPDDLAIIIGWAFSVALTALGCVSVWVYGVGRHVWDVEPEYYDAALFSGWLAQIFFILSTCGTKMSVFLFYARLLKGIGSKNWIYANWTFAGLTAGIWIAGLVAECFMCTPLHAFWNYIYMDANDDYSYTCLNGDAMTIAIGVLTVGSDFWTAALPCVLTHVYDLGLTKRQKIAMNVIFCLGFIVTGVGGVRTYYLWEIGHNMDISWIGYDLFATAITECQLAVICTCAPFCRAFLRSCISGGSRSKSGLSTGGRSAGNRASDCTAGRNRTTSTATLTSKEGLGFPEQHVELHDLSENGDDLGEPQLCVLSRDEKTGRISLQTRSPPTYSLDTSIGSSKNFPWLAS